MVLYDRENNGYIFYSKSKIIITFESLLQHSRKRGFFSRQMQNAHVKVGADVAYQVEEEHAKIMVKPFY